MKLFGIYTDNDNEILGSDKLFKFDNRKRLENNLIDAEIQSDKLKHVQRINGINVYKGRDIREMKFMKHYELKDNQK